MRRILEAMEPYLTESESLFAFGAIDRGGARQVFRERRQRLFERGLVMCSRCNGYGVMRSLLEVRPGTVQFEDMASCPDCGGRKVVRAA